MEKKNKLILFTILTMMIIIIIIILVMSWLGFAYKDLRSLSTLTSIAGVLVPAVDVNV